MISGKKLERSFGSVHVEGGDSSPQGPEIPMVKRTASAVGRDVHTLFRVGAVGGLTDGELLERFVSRQEGWSESAFATLVERHGPMVWGVCSRVLNDPHAAADLQATFLVLVRRAAVIRVDDSLGRWLYGVSRRIALRAKRATAGVRPVRSGALRR